MPGACEAQLQLWPELCSMAWSNKKYSFVFWSECVQIKTEIVNWPQNQASDIATLSP